MEIDPRTFEESINLVRDILCQGDQRYFDLESEVILAKFLLCKAISLEEKEFPHIITPTSEELINIQGVQKSDKYIAKILLKQQGFKENEIFYEIAFGNYRPDILAESLNQIIAVEGCSCKVSKIIDYLDFGVGEIWVFSAGLPPYEKIPYLKEKMQWFIFKKGEKWEDTIRKHKEILKEQLKKVKSPIDTL